MQIWQLLVIPRHPVTILVSAFTRADKLTSVNKKDLQALTSKGPPRDNPEPDPLAAQHHDNQLYMKY